MVFIFCNKILSASMVMLIAACGNAAGFAQDAPAADSTAPQVSDQDLVTPQNAGAANADQPQQAVIDLLVQQLDQLIPGDYESESVQFDKLYDIANFFAAGDEALVRAKITELAELDSELPPPDLLLAGLAFAANNALQGKALLERAGTNHRRHPGIAIAFAQLAIAQDRLFDASALIEKAKSQVESSELADATKTFYSTAVLKSQTVIETRRRDFRRAREFASQWEELEPGTNDMLLATAEIEFLLKNPDTALDFLNRRDADQIAEVPTEVIMARWYRGINDSENYAKWIALAHEKFPSSPLSQIEYGTWLMFEEKFDQATELVAKFEAEHGESAESQLIKGRIAFAQQDFVAAEALFGGLYSQQPGDFENSYLFILSMLESNDAQKIQQSAALAQRNLQLNPNNQLALAAMGWALLKIGNREGAQQLLSRAANTGNMLPDTAYFMAELMVDLDRKAQAKSILEPFLETDQTFLYRPAARKLIENIDRDDKLPEPGAGG